MPISGANPVGKSFLGAITIISYIVYAVLAYKYSRLSFLIALKEFDEYKNTYIKYTKAECMLTFTYASTRDNID